MRSHPTGKVLLFAHIAKLKKYFDGDRLMAQYRTLIADPRVCVLVNEPAPPRNRRSPDLRHRPSTGTSAT